MVVGIETNGVMFFATSPSGTVYWVLRGVGRILGAISLLQTNGKRVFVRFFLLCTILGHLHICPCLFVLFLVFFYLLVISVALLSEAVIFGGGF